MNLKDFVNGIRGIYEDRLLSIVLYGSAAAEDFSQKYSDYNLIIVLNEVSPAELEKAVKIIKKWIKSGNKPPLFFDLDHISTSADVFPMEFNDIKSNRKVLFGKDTFADVDIENSNLRHQCEYELKGKILQLYSHYLECGGKDKRIAKLMMEALSTFISIFKGIVHLLGHKPKQKKRAIVEQLSNIIGFSPNIFFELLDVRDGSATLPRKDATEKFEDYMTELKVISNFVDKFEITTRTLNEEEK